MTISATARRAGPFLGNGAATSFAFTFKVFSSADIAVSVANSAGVETVLVLDADYTVTLNANQDTSPGGSLTYPISGVPLPVGSTLAIVGDIDFNQPLDLPTGGNFSPLALENQLDRTVMQIQQLEESLERALLLPVNSSFTVSLPTPAAGELLGWDQSETGIINYTFEDIVSTATFTSWVYDTFTGTGAKTVFTLQRSPGSIANCDVSVDGVTLVPLTDFSLSGATLTFITAPGNGTEILVRYGNAAQQGTYAVETERKLATAGQTVVTLTQVTYVPGGNHIAVYLNGVRLSAGFDFTETSSTSITLTDALALNDEIVCVVGSELTASLASQNVGFLQAGTGAVSRDVRSALRDRISVKDYGATGNGVTDDVVAIQAAFDANPNATVLFPAGTYICSASIVLTNASGKNFQGSIVGDNAAITFTNAGSSGNADSAMQRGFSAYPTLNAAGGDISAMRKVQISGLDITGPTNGASIYLANCQDVTLRDVRTTTSRYGVVTECCINTGFYDCVFEDYTNAGVGLLMLSDTARVWYGSAVTPLLTYWNDSPLFQKCDFKNSLLTQPLAHILDHGSMAESVRSIGGCLLYSRWDGSGAFIGTQYGILARSAQWHSFGSNWTENVSYPIRILEEASIEGTGNVTGVAGAQPSGTYSLTNFPNGFSYTASITGWWFARAFEAINISGVRGVAQIGNNVDQLMQNGGVHLKSISTSTAGKVIDDGDSIVAPAGSYAYSSFVSATRIDGSAQWQTWTPTITASTGSITAYTVNSARYLQRGKEVQVRLDATITTNGTGTSALLSTLPVSAVTNGGVLAGREDVVTGNMLQGLASGATLTILTSTNTYPGADSARIVLSGVYEGV
jgi:hypothetical protein